MLKSVKYPKFIYLYLIVGKKYFDTSAEITCLFLSLLLRKEKREIRYQKIPWRDLKFPTFPGFLGFPGAYEPCIYKIYIVTKENNRSGFFSDWKVI